MSNFANFKKQQDKPSQIELKIRKAQPPETQKFEGFMSRSNNNSQNRSFLTSNTSAVDESVSSDTPKSIQSIQSSNNSVPSLGFND
jgi:hypothetical protein